MSEPSDCYDCQHANGCEYTSMLYCKVNMKPAWMAHNDYFDYDKSECSKKVKVEDKT